MAGPTKSSVAVRYPIMDRAAPLDHMIRVVSGLDRTVNLIAPRGERIKSRRAAASTRARPPAVSAAQPTVNPRGLTHLASARVTVYYCLGTNLARRAEMFGVRDGSTEGLGQGERSDTVTPRRRPVGLTPA